jgi:hypothetical protein
MSQHVQIVDLRRRGKFPRNCRTLSCLVRTKGRETELSLKQLAEEVCLYSTGGRKCGGENGSDLT